MEQNEFTIKEILDAVEEIRLKKEKQGPLFIIPAGSELEQLIEDAAKEYINEYFNNSKQEHDEKH